MSSINRPHKRLNLLLPSETPEPDVSSLEEPAETESEATSTPPESTPQSDAENASVRVMAYLTPDEAASLDALWLALRRRGTRASKSDVLRAALTLAAPREEELANALTQQHVSTLSRQRSSKTARK